MNLDEWQCHGRLSSFESRKGQSCGHDFMSGHISRLTIDRQKTRFKICKPARQFFGAVHKFISLLLFLFNPPFPLNPPRRRCLDLFLLTRSCCSLPSDPNSACKPVHYVSLFAVLITNAVCLVRTNSKQRARQYGSDGKASYRHVVSPLDCERFSCHRTHKKTLQIRFS